MEAAARVRALVSGFPGARATSRGLLMLQAYVDASGKGDKSRLIIAGYIASAEDWADFSCKWQERLNEADINRFKMNEWSRQPEIAGYFYRLVEEPKIIAAISCVVHTEELTSAFNKIRWPHYISNLEAFYNPYYFAFKAIIDVLAQHQHKLKITEPVDFIFDEEGEKVNTIKYYDLIKRSSAPQFRGIMGDTPIYRDDEKTMPLQAADLYAWWILKWEREGIKDWESDLPFPWGAKRDITRLCMRFRERDFIKEWAKGLKKYARNMPDLVYAESLS